MLPDRAATTASVSFATSSTTRASLLFLIPGVGRTLRINGRAAISIDRKLCASFAMEGKVPRSVIVVTAGSVYTQCPKARVRSRLWDARLPVDESSLPSSGTIMKSMQKGFDGETYDRDYPAATQGNNLLNRRARANTVRKASLPLLARLRPAAGPGGCLLIGVDRKSSAHP